MKSVEYLIGNENIAHTPMRAYSDAAVAFISDLSSAILKSPVMRAYPDVAALGFWGRKGNLLRLKQNCPEAENCLGRGLCLHIAPSNIPMNFAFSYLFGLLSGCANLVRLPSGRFPQTEVFLEIMQKVLKDHSEVANRSAFIRYPADNDTSQALSQMADARMIWGGDRTINTFRSMKTRPKCIDIAFSDRYSLAVIDGKAVLEADGGRLTRLAEDFYNDTYLMDQNACSSPMVICWMSDSPEARQRFWGAVIEVVKRKYILNASVAVDKFTKSCEDAIDRFDNISGITRETNLLYRVELNGLVPELEEYRGRGGYFYEYSMKRLEELAACVTEKYQTVTWFGLDPEEIRRVVLEHRLTGIDRITPIGKAMDIGVIWDGYDLVRMLSRLVHVE